MGLDRYDIVKLTKSFWGDDFATMEEDELEFELDDERLDDEYMIEYSAFDYGCGSNHEYSIINLRTGKSSAWWQEDCLEFVRHGTKKEYYEAKCRS